VVLSRIQTEIVVEASKARSFFPNCGKTVIYLSLYTEY